MIFLGIWLTPKMNNSQTKNNNNKIWHRLDSGQISLKDKKTILDTRLKKTDLAFFWISVVWRKKMSIHGNIFTDWLTDKGRDNLFVTFETLHFIFLDTGLKWTQTKIWTITYIDYLTDTRPTYNESYQIQVFFFNSCRWNDPKDKWLDNFWYTF